MELYKVNCQFTNLEELYFGFIKKLASKDDIIDILECNKINFNREDYSKLFCTMNSDEEFMKVLRERENLNKEVHIKKLEPSRIWELEYLLREIQKYKKEESSKSELLDNIYRLFYFFEFPREWSLNKFLLYSMNDSGKPLNEDELYDNLLSFVEKEVVFFTELKN
jgi:hypothetical protein